MYDLSLNDTILLMEADSVFDKENFSSKDEKVLEWLRELKAYKDKESPVIYPTSHIIAITGHRPNKLYGYDLSDERWTSLKNDFFAYYLTSGCTKVMVGMALGTDMIAALAVIDLKLTGHKIELECAIPCKNHTSKWKDQKTLDLYDYILSYADKITIVSDVDYNAGVMQKRNEYMVDLADEVLAVWDGTEKSGTANCIKYAKSKNKKITNIFKEA